MLEITQEEVEEHRNNIQIQNNNKQTKYPKQTNNIQKKTQTKPQTNSKTQKINTPTINDWYGIDTCDEDLEFCSHARVCVLKRVTLFLIIF